jgi:preprotein translocase subunit SecA
MIDEICEDLVHAAAPEKVYPEEWDLVSLKNRIYEIFFFHIEFDSLNIKEMTREGLLDNVLTRVRAFYENKEKKFGEDEMRSIERFFVLNSLDTFWKEHLLALDHLKEGIGLRGYAQKDPLREYQRESFDLFLDMLERVKYDTIQKIFAVQPAKEEIEYKEPVMNFNLGGDGSLSGQQDKKDKKTGRNDPCPCGSGKKYKKCCGK